MPQLIPRTDAGWEGFPSVGYMVRIYNGDPNVAGVEIPTTTEQSGAVVGWWMNFGPGAIKVASSFTNITDPGDVWMTGFRYIGQSIIDIATSTVAPLRTDTRFTGFTLANTVLDLTANGATWTKIGDDGSLGLNAGEFNSNTKIRVLRNGVEQEKGANVIYNSATTFHFVDDLYTNELLYTYREL